MIFLGLKEKKILINKIPVKALRVNYVGELGWELHHPMNQMVSLYDAIYEVGKKQNIINFWNLCSKFFKNGKKHTEVGAVNSPVKLV